MVDSERHSLIARMKSQGIRLTPQRRAVAEALETAGHHLDAAELLERARRLNRTVDRATVYRTLDLLKKHRLVAELDLMHLEGEKHYYEASKPYDHIHLACFQCGRVEEFTTPLYEQLKAELAHRLDFDARVCRFEAGGVCSACRKTAPRGGTPALPA